MISVVGLSTEDYDVKLANLSTGSGVIVEELGVVDKDWLPLGLLELV